MILVVGVDVSEKGPFMTHSILKYSPPSQYQ